MSFFGLPWPPFSRRKGSFARICRERRRLGRRGERIARRVLIEYGMEFLVGNYRHGHGEIDLVFRDDDELCFVEVKTRRMKAGPRPAEAVGREKQRRLGRTAEGYLRSIGCPLLKCRFDIVEVLFDRRRCVSVMYIPGAFTCGLPGEQGQQPPGKQNASG